MSVERVLFGLYVASLKPFSYRLHQALLRAAYLATGLLFLWLCASFYIPGKGFTYLVMFGTKENARYIEELRAVNHYEQEDSHGYDAQYYAQIAMHPALDSQSLRDAVDSLPYRARRILFSWTAYALGGGDPGRALHIYAVQNIFCWLALAILMLRWFPPVEWGNFLRWFGVLFSSGLCLSVRGSLVDGPSLLLIAGAMALVEMRFPWLAAALLGVAGLGKETNVMAATGLPLPPLRQPKEWFRWVLRGLIVVLPLAIWMETLWLWLGRSGDAGMRNFEWPFVAYAMKWMDTWHQLMSEGVGSVAQWNMLTLVAMTTQWLFFALRPRWKEAWWRVGASSAVLMAFLGPAVWEGYPGAASRVLLPMTLAFNILLPRGWNWRWWLLLVLGNLTVVFSSDFLKPPGREDYRVEGPRPLIMVEKTGHTVEARFDDAEWFQPERSRLDYWRWSRGNATVTLHNPHDFAVIADVSFGLKSNDERHVTVHMGNSLLWKGETLRMLREVKFRGVLLEPGDTVWRFETDQAAEYPANGDPRRLAFSLRSLRLVVKDRAPIPAPPAQENPAPAVP